MPNATNMEHEEIFKDVEARGGPSYEVYYQKAIARYIESHRLLANWRPECFERVGVITPRAESSYEFRVLEQSPCTEEESTDGQMWCASRSVEADAKSMQKKDKQLLQSY